MAATVNDISLFKSGRHFAAWLGLVPRQHSTGGKTSLGRITKSGNRQLRTLLVVGATSMVYRADGWKKLYRHLAEGGAWAAPSTVGNCGFGKQDGAHRLGFNDAQRGLPCKRAASGDG